MKILMIGGTGNISMAVSELLLRQGHDLHLLCRGNRTHADLSLQTAKFHYGSIDDEPHVQSLLKEHTFDVVVNWVVGRPEQARRDIRLFAGKTAQYILISSASAYQKPVSHYLVTEDTPLANPYWEYSRLKIACENTVMEAYRENGFPATIVRPSLTFGNTIIPYIMGSWSKPWSLVDRLRRGKRVIVPGDGTSLWTITHNTDFAKGIVGLMGKEQTIGEVFHITSDEVLTWDDILGQIAEAVGAEARPAHISSEFILAFMPDLMGNLLGDKAVSLVFDNSKMKRFVPDFKATTPFRQGIKSTIEYLSSRPDLQVVDYEFEEGIDRIIKAHDIGMGLLRG